MEHDFVLVKPEAVRLNFVVTRHAAERCEQRGFSIRDVQRGLCSTAVVVHSEHDDPVVVTVLPQGAVLHTPKQKKRHRRRLRDRRAKDRARKMRVLEGWRRLTRAALDRVPDCWEELFGRNLKIV